MTSSLDLADILEHAGADPDAPPGSQSWSLALVAKAVGEMLDALEDCIEAQQPMSQAAATERARAVVARYRRGAAVG